LGSQCGDEGTVDEEVGSSNVVGALAGQQHDQISDLFRRGESACHRVGGLFGDISGFAAADACDRRSDPSSPTGWGWCAQSSGERLKAGRATFNWRVGGAFATAAILYALWDTFASMRSAMSVGSVSIEVVSLLIANSSA